MQIKNHWIVGADRVPTKKYSKGRKIVPKFIVYHYTAGWTNAGDLHTLTKSSKQVSCQLLVDRDGSFVQMGGFDKRMWHAGPSRSHGYKDLNSHSVGIEITNIGYLRPVGNGQYKWYNGKIVDGTKPLPNGIGGGVPPEQWEHAPNSVVGSGKFAWEPYADAVLETLDEITEALRDQYPIKHAVSHQEIDTRGWKSDPGPAFPLERYQNILEGLETPQPEPLEENTDVPAIWQSIVDLNVRSMPEWGDDIIIDTLRPDRFVFVLKREGDFLLISDAIGGDAFKGGWVAAEYMERQVQ